MDRDRSRRALFQALLLSGLLAESSAACAPSPHSQKLDRYRMQPSIASELPTDHEQELLDKVTARVQIDVPEYVSQRADVLAADSIKSGAEYFVISYLDDVDTVMALNQIRVMESLMYPGEPSDFGVIDSQTGSLMNNGPQNKAPKQEVYFYFLPASEDNPDWATNGDPCATQGTYGALPSPTSNDGCQAHFDEFGRVAVIVQSEGISGSARTATAADRQLAQANFLASVVTSLDAQVRDGAANSELSQAVVLAIKSAHGGAPFETYRNFAMMSGVSYVTEAAYGFIFHAIHIGRIIPEPIPHEDTEPEPGQGASGGALG